MTDVKKLIGNRIKTLRRARGMSQEELAETISMNTKYLEQYREGQGQSYP